MRFDFDLLENNFKWFVIAQVGAKWNARPEFMVKLFSNIIQWNVNCFTNFAYVFYL